MTQVEKKMDDFGRAEFSFLTEPREGGHVSIYMPTHRKGPETQQDLTRFKNLLQRAEEELVRFGMRSTETAPMLAEARALLDEPIFWQHQSDGLAIFLRAGIFRSYRVPLTLEEGVFVGPRFHLTPLLPRVDADQPFHVLALNLGGVKLYEGGQFALNEMALENVPKTLHEFLKYDDFEKSLQFRVGAPAKVAGARDHAAYHGHGGSGDDAQRKAKIIEFLRGLAKTVDEHLEAHRTPLVLAGTEHLRGEYRDASGSRWLTEKDIEINPTDLTLKELHKLAWEQVEPIYDRERKEALERYRRLSQKGDPRAVETLGEVVPAACYRRLETLFADRSEKRWGKFCPESGQVELHEQAEPGDEELVGMAATEALRNGGSVYVLEREAMPTDAPLAGIFRGSADNYG